MKIHMRFMARARFSLLPVMVGISLFTILVGCSSTPPSEPAQQQQAPARYSLSGRVVSVDKTKQQVVVDAADIPGYMMAMTMPYAVKNPSLLDGLSPEDQITADVVVNGNDSWLENIVVVKKPDQAKNPTPGKAHPAPPPPAKQ